MSEVRAFHGLRFARDPQPRLSGPYDTIYAEDRERLAAEPENIVHLILPPGEQGARDYDAAHQTLQKWIADGVLVRDAKPCLYVLEERTTDGRVRRGFLASVRLADYEEKNILPHERTMAGPKQDRLLLTRKVSANLEPLFFLYEDRDDKLAEAVSIDTAGECVADCVGPDGTGLRMFALDDPARIEAVRTFLTDRSLIIADGHHRYETMVKYRDECREAARAAGREPGSDDPHEFVMAYVVNAFDPGSRIQAIHRMLKGKLGEVERVFRSAGFSFEPIDGAPSAEALIERLEAQRATDHAFVLVFPDGRLVQASKSRGDRLDVQVLHEELIPGLGGELAFDSKPARLIERVHGGEAELGLMMNPTGAEELFRVVQGGTVLPQKSTFFAPKIPSGLVIRDLSD